MKRALSVLMAIVVLAVFAALPAFASKAPSAFGDAPQSGGTPGGTPQSGSASGDVSGPPSTQDRSMIVVIMSLILSVAAAMCASIVLWDRKNDRRN